ncbi:uncharacterized protein [Amphiura filiformis]|uniref:uncharacterized protein n=1 Tax=Amphiura filiformis TaxID=82378 RepID=UPI003B216D07
MEKLNRVSLQLLLCIAVCGPIEISTSANLVLPFIDDNSTDCSWMFYDGSEQKKQPCHVLPYDEIGFVAICPNPIPYPSAEEYRAVAVSDLKITEITKSLQYPTEPHRTGNYTCIQISYIIRRDNARLTHAVQFSIRSIDVYVDGDDHFCQVHKYSDVMSDQSSGLHYWSVISDYDNCGITEEHCIDARKVFIHDNFCGIVPGAQYDVSVRALPVDYSDDNKGYDTKQTKRYPTDTENASTSCDDKPEDVRCRKSKQASWTTKYINVQQDNSRRSNVKVNLTITFDIAPADYGFNQYNAILYKNWDENVEDYYIGNAFKLTPGLQNLTWKVEVHVFHCYRVRIIPRPGSVCTIGLDERDINCNYILGESFCPKVHPCTKHPCGNHAECLSPNGENYTCICDSGYVRYNNTCLRNPCLNDTGDDIGLCGPFGTCKFEISPNGGIQSNCSCKQGYQLQSVGICVGKYYDYSGW